MAEKVLVNFTWDSGPYGVYSQDKGDGQQIEGPGGYGSNTVLIPTEIWERYANARDELAEAESALGDAEMDALKSLRASDPRWKKGAKLDA